MQGHQNIWRWVGAGLVTAVVAAALPAIASAQAATTRLTATLSGANENPAVTSTATGTFTATLDEAAGTITWTLTVPAITNATAAHLHAGAAGVNGGVILPLFAAPTNAPSASINVSGTSKASDLTGTLANNFTAFATAIKTGGIYANVHTTANAGGEIRSQVSVVGAAATAAPAPAAPAPGKTGNAGLLGAERTSGLTAVLLLVVAATVVVGARAATRGARH